jgi:phosphoribosylanthranilate isomerase
MREAENIRAVDQLSIINCQLSIDWMGFIFWPKSSRYVSECPCYLPTHCKRVGVFVDADIHEVQQKVAEYGLDYIQLHGHERPDYIRQLRADGSSPAIIKAISISSHDDIATYKDYEGLVDYFLFDTKAQLPGGNGQQFDWNVLADYDGNTPFLLSGGIDPDDAERIRTFIHPQCLGIDLNSRFELAPALKDINKLKEFIKKVRI